LEVGITGGNLILKLFEVPSCAVPALLFGELVNLILELFEFLLKGEGGGVAGEEERVGDGVRR
jgi:hypothetical protein